MAMPPAKKLRKEQQRQQSKARQEEETRTEAAQSNPEDTQCSKCDRRFKNEVRCAIHVAWCTNDRKCAQCPNDTTAYPTDRALHRHCTFYHKPQGCSFCRATPAPQSREEHERKFHPREFKAREHIRQHHEPQRCSLCTAKVFPQDKEQHRRDFHPRQGETREYRREDDPELSKCRYCEVWFYIEDIEDHERSSHPFEFRDRQYKHILWKCSFCDARFTSQDRHNHEFEAHPREWAAREYRLNFPWERQRPSSEQKTFQEKKSPPEAPSHYKTLGVARDASAAEIERAAKMMRILSHPDRLKRTESTPEELIRIDENAKNVGCAADILCNEESRRKYDLKLNAFCY